MGTFHSFSLRLGLQSFTHDKLCPLSKRYPKSTAVAIASQYCGAILARAIRASFTINRGSGGVAISHTLEIARMVPNNSRAFQLVDFDLALTERKFKNIIDLDKWLRDSVKELQILFDNGSASSYDVNEKGDTLLHVRIFVTLLSDLMSLTSSLQATSKNIFRVARYQSRTLLETPFMELAVRCFGRLTELDIPLNWANESNR